MNRPFSKRLQATPGQFRDDVPHEARSRILYILKASVVQPHAGAFVDMLIEIHPALLKLYGRLFASSYEAARVSDNPVIEHFFKCPDAQALDFLELCFQSNVYFQSGCKNRVVEEVNEVFREFGIRFVLTPYVETLTGKPGLLFGKSAGQELKVEYPRAIKKDDEYLHENAVMPCLSILRQRRFKTANDELLKAEEHYRTGNYDDAIANCGKAFETVLKTICSEKGWEYDPDKDTLSKLIAICRESGLFPGFYAPIFEAAGTVRNKLGGHGKGPEPLYQVQRHHVEHALHVTCSHMLLLVRMANLDD